MGDFNIHLLKSCDYTNRFLEQLFTASYMPLILRPTRITHHTATLIDNIFTNDMETIESSTNGILFCDISDHLPVFHIREFKDQQHKTKPEMEIINKRIINDSNVKSFGNTIKTTSWEDVISNSNTAESYNEFFNKFSTAYEKNFPLTKKVSKRKFDKSKSSWMTKCIAKSVQKKNKLYKKFLNCPVIKNDIPGVPKKTCAV